MFVLPMVLTAPGCSRSSDPDTLHIGFPIALSGANQKAGEEIRRGIELALAEANQAGVAGKKVAILYNDTGSKPEQAKAMTVRMIFANRVPVVIGGDPGADEEVGWACQNSSPPVLMISPAGDSPKLTQHGPYVFRICLSSAARARALAAFAAQELKAKTAAIWRHEEEHLRVAGFNPAVQTRASAPPTAVNPFADAFALAFQKSGGKVMVNKPYPQNAEEAKAQLGRLKAEAPDVVLLTGPEGEVLRMRQALLSEGVQAKVLCDFGMEAEPEDRSALDGFYYSASLCSTDPEPMLQEFVKKHEAKYKAAPGILAGLGYDAARALFEAVRQANGTEPAKVRESLAGMQFVGLSGPISFEGQGNARRPALIVQVSEGKLKVVKKLQANEFSN